MFADSTLVMLTALHRQRLHDGITNPHHNNRRHREFLYKLELNFIEKMDTWNSIALELASLFVTLFPVFQIVLIVWRFTYQETYKEARSVALCIFPLIPLFSLWIMLKIGMWIFFVSWVLLVIMSLSAYVDVKKRPFHRSTPGAIIRTFHFIDCCCFFLNCAGIVTLIVALTSAVHYPINTRLLYYSFAFLFNGTYLGLLSHVFGDEVINRMVEYQGVGVGEILPYRGFSNTHCLVCGHPFEGSKISLLKCNHMYHEICIKGWVMMSPIAECLACRRSITIGHTNRLDRFLKIQHVLLENILDYFPIALWSLLIMFKFN